MTHELLQPHRRPPPHRAHDSLLLAAEQLEHGLLQSLGRRALALVKLGGFLGSLVAQPASARGLGA